MKRNLYSDSEVEDFHKFFNEVQNGYGQKIRDSDRDIWLLLNTHLARAAFGLGIVNKDLQLMREGLYASDIVLSLTNKRHYPAQYASVLAKKAAASECCSDWTGENSYLVDAINFAREANEIARSANVWGWYMSNQSELGMVIWHLGTITDDVDLMKEGVAALRRATVFDDLDSSGRCQILVEEALASALAQLGLRTSDPIILQEAREALQKDSAEGLSEDFLEEVEEALDRLSEFSETVH